jgi:prevent-host-death family protein
MAKISANVHEAKTQLSKLLERAEAGDDVVIARAGVPVARLVAIAARSTKRPRGVLRGRINVTEDFDAADSTIAALFLGEW